MSPRARYAATFLASSSFTLGALTNAQVSANVISDTARSAALGMNSLFAHLGGLVGTWAFLQWDAPNYMIGKWVEFGYVYDVGGFWCGDLGLDEVG